MTKGVITRNIKVKKFKFILEIYPNLEGQQDINKRIDELHEKVNQKISRQELSGWLVAISALVVLINNLM